MKKLIKGLTEMVFVFLFALVMVRTFMMFGPIVSISINETTWFMKSSSMMNNVSFWSGVISSLLYAVGTIAMKVKNLA